MRDPNIEYYDRHDVTRWQQERIKHLKQQFDTAENAAKNKEKQDRYKQQIENRKHGKTGKRGRKRKDQN